MKNVASKDDIKLFFNESEDLIQKIEQSILELEEKPNDKKPIQELFFAYHTLKGLTAMVGFENLSKFCHYFETFLENNKDPKNIKNREDFISLLFESLDVLRNHIYKAKKGKMEDLDKQFLKELNDTFNGFEAKSDFSFIKSLSEDQFKKIKGDKKTKFYKIYIRIQDTCVFKKVRLFIIFRALSSATSLCSTKPAPHVLEEGNFEKDFEIYCYSEKQPKVIEKILDEILEIENKVITELNAEEFYENFAEYQDSMEMSKIKRLDIMESDKEEETIGGISSIISDFEDKSTQITSVKININVLEKLMNYFGEVVILKNQLNQILTERQNWEINSLFDGMDKLFLEIQEIIFKLKLVRVESTFKKYRRLVRDLAKETGKQIRFVLEGLSVEIDRKILEELNSPIVHLLRNAIYHGIETAAERRAKNKSEQSTLSLKTYRRAGSIYIEIYDDGRGLDYEDIRRKAVEKGQISAEESMDLTREELHEMILKPGFSTLTDADMISGRGMGLAIVAEKSNELGGSIQIHSQKDKGTTFTLIVPFTRAILKSQLIKVANDLFAIPIENIEQIFTFKREKIEYIRGEEYYKLDNNLIPILYLDKFLDFINVSNDELKTNHRSKIGIWCKKDEEYSAVFVVDEILKQMELVIKPFRSKFSGLHEILGVSITGDGSICLIIDVINIISSLVKNLNEIKLVKSTQEV